MKRTLLWLAAALTIAAACQKQENSGGNDNTPATSGEKTFQATLPSLTKVTLENGLALSWTKADKVSVFDGAGNKMFRAQGSGASAELLGSAAAADTYYAIFPYDASATLSGSIVQTKIATEQTASAGGADIQVLSAAKSDGDNLAFSPVSAVLSFTLDEDAEGVNSVKIKTAEGALSGTVSIDCGGKPVLSAGTTSSEIKVSAFEGTFKAGATYYVSAIPGKVGKITLTYTVGNDEMEVSADATTLTAGGVYELPNLTRAMSAQEKAFLGTWLLLKYGSRGADGTPGVYPWVNIERGFENPASVVGDFITFKSDGSVVMDLGEASDTYNNTTYEAQTVQMTGKESWEIVKEGDVTYVQFGGNAFPLMIADNTGIGGKYSVVSVSESEMLLEYPYEGEEGPSVLGIFLQPKGKETYVHSFKSYTDPVTGEKTGDFGVTDEGAEETAPFVDGDFTWFVEVEAAMPFFYMNPNAGLMIGRAWGVNAAAESAKSARMWTESFADKKIVSVTVSTARFAPEEGEDKSAADVSVYIGGTKIGATYSLVNDMIPYTFTAPDPVAGLLEIKWQTTNEEVNCYFVKTVQVVYEEE